MAHDNDEREDQRTSLYLVRRAEALLGALKFFIDDRANPPARRLVFLAQMDFWEWEMENLIYSFTNFAERSKSWRWPKYVQEKLWAIGVVANATLYGPAKWRRGMWHVERNGRRVAPVELLAETVEAWNRLIDLAEENFVRKFRQKIERFNIQARKDLQYLKKKMPALEATETE